MTYMGIFGLEFESNIDVLDITTLEFAKLQNFVKKWKCLNLGLKIPSLGIFGLEFQKAYIWNQHTRICLIPKFCEKTKMPYLSI